MGEMNWTPLMVEERIVEAADVLRRLPEERVRGYFGVWPEVVHDFADKVGQERSHAWMKPCHGWAGSIRLMPRSSGSGHQESPGRPSAGRLAWHAPLPIGTGFMVFASWPGSLMVGGFRETDRVST